MRSPLTTLPTIATDLKFVEFAGMLKPEQDTRCRIRKLIKDRVVAVVMNIRQKIHTFIQTDGANVAVVPDKIHSFFISGIK